MFLCIWDQPSISFSAFVLFEASVITCIALLFFPVNFKEIKGIVALLQAKFRCFLPCLSRESLKVSCLLCEHCTKQVYELVFQKSLTPNELMGCFLNLERASVWWKSCYQLQKWPRNKVLVEGEGQLCWWKNRKGEMTRHRVWVTVEKISETLLTSPPHDHCPSIGSCHIGAEMLDELISGWVMQLKALSAGEAQAVQRICGTCDPGWPKLLHFCVLVTSPIPSYKRLSFETLTEILMSISDTLSLSITIRTDVEESKWKHRSENQLFSYVQAFSNSSSQQDKVKFLKLLKFYSSLCILTFILQNHLKPYLELKLHFAEKFENKYQWVYPDLEYLPSQR